MMRITNSMMMNTSKTNINSNKVSVDRLNTQMSTQKKITKPSDNPLIAIKSLRLSTTLSQINQYYNNNIKDARSWMDVTETALTNMKDIFNDAYRLAVNGATDTLTDENRDTILTQLKSLSSQLYAEANAEYAERTVFSGYKTNSTVAFTDSTEAANAKYEITEQLYARDLESYTYYANQMDTPTASELADPTNAANVVKTPQEETLKRLRLSYNKLSDLDSFSYNYSVDTSSSHSNGTLNGNVTITTEMPDVSTDPTTQTFQWRSSQKDGAFTYYANENGLMIGGSMENMNGQVLNFDYLGNFSVEDSSITCATRRTMLGNVETTVYTFTDENGDMAFTAQIENNSSAGTKTGYVVDAQGNRVELTFVGSGGTNIKEIKDMQGNTINTNYPSSTGPRTITVKNADGDEVLTATTNGTGTGTGTGNTYKVHTADKNLDTELKVVAMTQTEFDAYLSDLAADYDTVSENYKDTLIYLPDSGELVFGNNIAQVMASEYATLNVTYDKNGFEKGETRPEMYFNCVNKTDVSPANHIRYTNFDADNNWIHQDIDYAVSANQDMTINTQIHDVASADCYRDLAEMTDVVQSAIDAHTTVSEIEKMLESSDYTSDDQQNYLKDCLEKAKKQMAYMDDKLQKVFGTQMTHFEKYAAKVNLAITEIGSRGDQLDLAENRISGQKTTFTELKSNNEDEEISDITIDYTSAFSAFQASLQAAGKIDNMSLLDYL